MSSENWSNYHSDTAEDKLSRWGVRPSDIQSVLDNYGSLPRLPDFIRSRFIQFMHNASATGRRLRWGGEGTHLGAHTPCFFCGEKAARGDKGKDSWEHLLTSCPIVNRAREKAAIDYAIPSAEASFAFFTLSKGPTPVRENVFVLAFLYSIWEARLARKQGTGNPHTLIGLHLEHTLHSLGPSISVDSNPLKVPGSRDYERELRKEKRGISSKKAQAVIKVRDLLAKNQDAILAFTDGSADPNPGPCGSGVYIKGAPTSIPSRTAFSAGLGSNNVGELHAIGIAARLLYIVPPSSPPRKMFILSDSEYAISIARSKATPRAHLGLARAVRDAVLHLRSRHPISLVWVPGHMGVEGNEIADHLAGLGARNNSGRTQDIAFNHAWFYDRGLRL